MLIYGLITTTFAATVIRRLNAVTASLNNHENLDFALVISEIYSSIVNILNTGATYFVPRRTNNFYKF